MLFNLFLTYLFINFYNSLFMFSKKIVLSPYITIFKIVATNSDSCQDIYFSQDSITRRVVYVRRDDAYLFESPFYFRVYTSLLSYPYTFDLITVYVPDYFNINPRYIELI